MTLQIGLVGRDGIVLASDRSTTQLGSIRDSSQICKILTVHDNAFAFAGDDCSMHVAMDLQEKWARVAKEDNDDPSQTLRHIAETRFRRDAHELSAARWETVRNWPRSVLAIVNGSLWRTDIGRTSVVKHIIDKSIAGDVSNSARFFSEQYYSPAFYNKSGRDRSTDELILLASHVILMGHDRNYEYVSGLDVAVWTASERGGILRLLVASELGDLAERSRTLDELVHRTLFGV